MMNGVGLVRIGEKARPEAAFRFLVAFELFQQPSAVVEEDGTVLIGLQGCLPELQSAFWILKRFMAEPGIDGGSKEVGASRQGALERRRGVSGCPGRRELDTEVIPSCEDLRGLMCRHVQPGLIERYCSGATIIRLQSVDDVDEIAHVKGSEKVT